MCTNNLKISLRFLIIFISVYFTATTCSDFIKNIESEYDKRYGSQEYNDVSYNNHSANVKVSGGFLIDKIEREDEIYLKNLEYEFIKAAITDYYNLHLGLNPVNEFMSIKDILNERNKILEKYDAKGEWKYRSCFNSDWTEPLGLMIIFNYYK